MGTASVLSTYCIYCSSRKSSEVGSTEHQEDQIIVSGNHQHFTNLDDRAEPFDIHLIFKERLS